MSARAWAAFAFVATVWGIPYLFIKLAVDEVPPVVVAWSRIALGAAVLLPIAWRAGALHGLRARAVPIAAYAVCEITIPFPLIAAGERHVSSSLTAILIAAVPLAVALLALRFDHSERVRGTRLAGLFIGLAGVVALVGIDVAGRPDELLGAAFILTATIGYAAGPMILKRHLRDVDPKGPVVVSLVIAATLLAPFVALYPPTAAPSTTAIASIVVLGVACTALALVVFNALIAEVGPSRATVITYISPIVAVALGVTVLGERPGVGAAAGLLLILAGSWLSTDGRLPPGLGATARALGAWRPWAPARDRLRPLRGPAGGR